MFRLIKEKVFSLFQVVFFPWRCFDLCKVQQLREHKWFRDPDRRSRADYFLSTTLRINVVYLKAFY